MYYLQTKASFDAAHFLWKYEGKCRNIHGHRWNVVVKIKSQELEQEGQIRGMVVDFGNLKKDLKKLCDSFDHSLIYEVGAFHAMPLHQSGSHGFRFLQDQALHPGLQEQSVRLTL